MPNDTAVRLPQQNSSAPSRTGETVPAARREHRFDIDVMRLVCSATIMVGHVGAQLRLVSPDLSGPAAGLLLAGLVVAVMTLSFGVSLLWGRLNLRRLLG